MTRSSSISIILKNVLVCVSCVLLCWAATTQAQANVEAGEPLRSALDRYAELGLNIISSSSVVSQSMKVTTVPDPTVAPIEQIRAILAPHGLKLVMVDSDNGYVERLEQPPEPMTAKTELLASTQPDLVEEIVVTSHYRFRRQHNQQHSVDHQDLQAAPSLARDPLRSLEALPGVASSGVSARHQFRGGNVDEVLYRLDGVELLEPFHLPNVQELFSIINMHIVEAADVYIAGFPVNLGSRMSGVVDLELAEPRDPLSGNVDLNFINAAADASGWHEEWSWLISARRSLVDKALQQLDTDYGTPRFQDEFLSLRHSTETREISINLLNSRDRITIRDTGEAGQGSSDYNAAWLRWQQDHSPALTSSWALSFVGIDNVRRGSVNIPSFSTGDLYHRQDFSATEISNDWHWHPSQQWQLEAGWSAARQQADYAAAFDVQYGELALPIQQRPSLDREIDIDRSGESTQAYISATYQMAETVEIQTGIRYDGQDIDPVHVNELSARLNINWQATPAWLFALNIGRYTQQQHLYEIQIDDGKAELNDPQHSDQINITSIWAPRDTLRLRLDLYYRKIDNAWSHFENLYNRWVLFPELAGDRFEISPSKVRADGLEFTLTHTPNKAWTWYLHFSHASTREDYLNKLRDRPWAQEHTAKAGVRWQNERWRVGFNGSYRDGWPTTSLLTSPAQLPDKVFADELPHFFTLDAHLSRVVPVPRGELEFYLDVMNLTGRDNIGGYDYYSVDSRNAKTLLPLTPVFGVLWRW